jgi:hypothetical protein
MALQENDGADRAEPIMVGVVSWGANFSYGLTCVPAVVSAANVSSIWVDVREFYPRDPDEGRGKGSGKKGKKGGGRADSLSDKRLRDDLLRGEWPEMIEFVAGRIEQELSAGHRQMLVMVNCSAGRHRAPFSAMLLHVWLSRQGLHSGPVRSRTFHVTLGRSPIIELSKAVDWLDDGESCSTRSQAMISDSGARREMADVEFSCSLNCDGTERIVNNDLEECQTKLALCETELASRTAALVTSQAQLSASRSEMRSLKSEIVLLSDEVAKTKSELLQARADAARAQADAANSMIELDNYRRDADAEIKKEEEDHEAEGHEEVPEEAPEEAAEEAAEEDQAAAKEEQDDESWGGWSSSWPAKKRRWERYPAAEQSTSVSSRWVPPPPARPPPSRSSC